MWPSKGLHITAQVHMPWGCGGNACIMQKVSFVEALSFVKPRLRRSCKSNRPASRATRSVAKLTASDGPGRLPQACKQAENACLRLQGASGRLSIDTGTAYRCALIVCNPPFLSFSSPLCPDVRLIQARSSLVVCRAHCR
jgi:hypothetical protein